MNLETRKLVFTRDEGQHPYVPENAAFRLTHTKTSYRSSVFTLELQRPRITLLLHLFGEPVLRRCYTSVERASTPTEHSKLSDFFARSTLHLSPLKNG